MFDSLIDQQLQPETARRRLRIRQTGELMLLFAGFSLALEIAAFTFPSSGIAIIFIVLLGLSYFLYFRVLLPRPLWLRCTNPPCAKLISSHTPWRCACGAENRNVERHSFLSECEKCGVAPKSYKCHHKGCGAILFFTSDHEPQGYAQSAAVAEQVTNPTVEKISRKRDQIALKDLKVQEAHLKAQLNELNRKPKTSSEALLEQYRTLVGSADEAKRLRAEIETQFINDPETKAERLRILNLILRDLA